MKMNDTLNDADTSAPRLLAGSASKFPLPVDIEQTIDIPVSGADISVTVAIGAQCTNIPVGGKISLACTGTPALSPTVDTGWLYITVPNYVAMVQTLMPQRFSGTLTIRYHSPPGSPLPADAAITPIIATAP